MAPPRKKPGRDPTPNLYEKFDKRTQKTYYTYRDPRNGRFIGLGTDRARAITASKASNALIYAELANKQVQRIASPSGPTVATFARKYLNIIASERTIAANTDRTRTYILHKVIEKIGSTPINHVTVNDLAGIISGYRERGKARMAQSVRSVLMDLWRVAISEGLCSENPAAATRNPRVDVKRQRLSLDQFKDILTAAEASLDPWVSNAMLLGLLTGQRREDIVTMRFRDVKEGYLEIVQGKTGARIRIATSLRLAAIGLSVVDVITRCRDNVVSPYIIHHTVRRTCAEAGSAVHKDTLSRNFARAREAAGLTGPAQPSYHEIRSLAARLYKLEGVAVQSLLGHTDSRMTDTYVDSRGTDWVVVG